MFDGVKRRARAGPQEHVMWESEWAGASRNSGLTDRLFDRAFTMFHLAIALSQRRDQAMERTGSLSSVEFECAAGRGRRNGETNPVVQPAGGAAVQFATFAGGPTLAASDILAV